MFYLMSVPFLKIKSYTLKHRKKKKKKSRRARAWDTHTLSGTLNREKHKSTLRARIN